MQRCKACGEPFRKGTIAVILTPEGLRGARVCGSCARGGALLVAPKLPPVVQEKRVRSPDVDRVLRQLRTFAAAARMQSKDQETTQEGPYLTGRVDAYESAIELIKRELAS